MKPSAILRGACAVTLLLGSCAREASEPNVSPLALGATAHASAPVEPPAAARAANPPSAALNPASSGTPQPVAAEVPARPFEATGCAHPKVKARCARGWCTIPSGCFVMGSPESEWSRGFKREEQRAVTLRHGFAMQQHEVSQAEWSALGLANPSAKLADGTGDCIGPKCPVGNVTWFEAAAFANLLSERHNPPLEPCYQLSSCTGSLGSGMKCAGAALREDSVYACSGFRLPTDAEWEYAARAGTRSTFPGGDIQASEQLGECRADPKLAKIAWYCHNSAGTTHPTGLLKPNAWGLYDLLGNAQEWVNDVSTGLPPDRATDPGGQIGTAPARVKRGCGFNGFNSSCRAAAHSTASWDMRGPSLGFRLVRTLQ